MRFTHTTLRQRVVFGVGTVAADLVEEVRRREARRVLLIATSSASELGDRLEAALPMFARLNGVRRHVPVEDAEAARSRAADVQADMLVAVGGGSAIGLAKAIALTAHTAIVAVPTTYSGSEGTTIWGMTENGRKTTGHAEIVLPETVIYDAQLVAGLPHYLAAASGLNAVAHAVDAMWAPQANPINHVWASEAIRALARDLPRLAESSNTAGQQVQYGAYLSAVAFTSAGSGLHHKICHVLGGAFDLPHAQTHAVVLPYVVAFNAPAAPAAAQRIARAFGTSSALDGLLALQRDIRAPTALKDHGLTESDLDKAAQLIYDTAPATNPRTVSASDAEALVYAAWAGNPPQPLGANPT